MFGVMVDVWASVAALTISEFALQRRAHLLRAACIWSEITSAAEAAA
jgi:hypothetical protein